jgi:hypothetical protein
MIELTTPPPVTCTGVSVELKVAVVAVHGGGPEGVAVPPGVALGVAVGVPGPGVDVVVGLGVPGPPPGPPGNGWLPGLYGWLPGLYGWLPGLFGAEDPDGKGLLLGNGLDFGPKLASGDVGLSPQAM